MVPGPKDRGQVAANVSSGKWVWSRKLEATGGREAGSEQVQVASQKE